MNDAEPKDLTKLLEQIERSLRDKGLLGPPPRTVVLWAGRRWAVFDFDARRLAIHDVESEKQVVLSFFDPTEYADAELAEKIRVLLPFA